MWGILSLYLQVLCRVTFNPIQPAFKKKFHLAPRETWNSREISSKVKYKCSRRKDEGISSTELSDTIMYVERTATRGFLFPYYLFRGDLSHFYLALNLKVALNYMNHLWH